MAAGAEIPFIPIAAFGADDDRLLEWPDRTGVGHSIFNGQIVFTNWERKRVERLLPTGLMLARNTKLADFHPVIHIVGEQTDTGWSLGDGRTHSFDQPYQEFILAVPFVQLEERGRWHTFVVRMYLNSAIAQELGELFGYRKKIGFVRFDRDHDGGPREHRVIDEEGADVFSSTEDDSSRIEFTSDGEAERHLPSYRDIKRIMAMPVLGVDPQSQARLCSRFEWTFERVSLVASIRTNHAYTPDFDPPILAQKVDTLSAESGGIYVQGLQWTLALPAIRCDELRPGRKSLQGEADAKVAHVPLALARCRECKASLPQNAKFCPQCGAPVSGAREPVRQTAAGDGERRQASVLFADLVGSTTLASTMDPEAFRDLLREYRRRIEQAVAANGGVIAQYFGDGVLIFFGYPNAREDAAEQAVSAGLEIIRALRAGPRNDAVSVRVAAATGIVVASQLDEKAFSQGDVAVGGPVWLAARLQGVAPVDGLVISEETYKVAGHLFECRSLGEQALKGFAQRMPAWLVTDYARTSSRYAARHAARGAEPMAGRQAELEQLLHLWQEVTQTKQAASVAIVAEAGFGKSRLVEALLERLADAPHVQLQYHCAPRFTNTALYPVVAQLEHKANFERSDSPQVKLQKVEEMLAQSTGAQLDRLAVAYIASLLAIPRDPSYPALPEAAERRREGLLLTLLDILVAVAGTGPLLILLEDWHWSDLSTRELLGRAAQTLAERAVMFVLTSRDELAEQWEGVRPRVMRLSRLDDAASRLLIDRIAAGRALPSHAVERVLRRAEGVPLYVEEITRGLIESGAGADAGNAADSMRAAAVPSTLRDLMLARLDSLAEAKRVAQVAAAIGREFSYRLLQALIPASEAELRGALEVLVKTDVVHRRSIGPESQFLFRHALIQEAAYETILIGRRRGLHVEIAHALLECEPETAKTRPELLAHHFSEGGELLRASQFFHQAGMLAASRAANVEASVHFRAAIRALDSLPPSPERYALELAAHVELGLTVTALEGYAVPEVSAIYERARDLCAQLGNNAALFPVLRGLCTFYMMRGEFDTALELSHACERIGSETGCMEQRIEAAVATGYSLVYVGKLAQGRRKLEEAVAAYRARPANGEPAPSLRHGALAAYAMIAIVAWAQGEMAYSAHCTDESLRLAESSGRPFDCAYAYCFAAMLANFREDTPVALALAEKGIAVASEHGFKNWLLAGHGQRAIARLRGGDSSGEPLAILSATAQQWHATGAELNLQVFLAALAAAALMTGELAAASSRIDEAIAQADRCNETWLYAELQRLRGFVYELSGRSDAAAAAYARGVDIAIEQQAWYLGLRSVLCLAACDAKAMRTSRAGELATRIAASLPADARETPEYAAASALLH